MESDEAALRIEQNDGRRETSTFLIEDMGDYDVIRIDGDETMRNFR